MFRGSLRKYFLTGLLIVLPIVLTLWVLIKGFYLITDFLFKAIQFYYPLDSFKLTILARLGSLVTIFIALVLIGVIARNVFGKRLLGWIDLVCGRIPIFGRIYSSIRQVIQALIGQEKTIFKEVVLIEYPRKGLYSVAFLTSEGKGEIERKTASGVINVFVPTTPNPTSGMLIMIPREEIIRLDMTVEDGMKLVVSGGAVVPNPIMEKPKIRNTKS